MRRGVAEELDRYLRGAAHTQGNKFTRATDINTQSSPPRKHTSARYEQEWEHLVSAYKNLDNLGVVSSQNATRATPDSSLSYTHTHTRTPVHHD